MPATSPVSCINSISMLSLPEAVWRGDQLGSYRSTPAATGFADLDKELPGGGWPPSVLIELLLPHPGIGELRLLAPILGRLTQAGKTLILLAPPYIPFAPALKLLGIDLKNVFLVNVDKPTDRVWAVEQALKSAGFGAVLCWLPQVKTEHLRRLQLAAGAGEGLAFVFRPCSAQEQSSPAPLRLLCQAASGGELSVEIFKRRGPGHAEPLVLPLPLPSILSKKLAARTSTTTVDSLSHAVDRHSLTATAARRRTAFAV